MASDRLHPVWLKALEDPATYPHPVSQIRILQTHISWVALTGDWAYKLKKPVDFGFVNFTTLELRLAACRDEMRLNRRTAPELYDDIIALTEDSVGPRFGGSGTILEYAVRMRQFPQHDLLDQCLARNEFTFDLTDKLAHRVAELHQAADQANDQSAFGNPDAVRQPVQECLDHLQHDSVPTALRQSLRSLDDWTNLEFDRLQKTFVERKRRGMIRECHGDLHLGNIVLYGGQPTLFDCLEFNAHLRWIDIISDIAFLMMDLEDHHARHLAWRFLNAWLVSTGDYRGLQVLRYYIVYRALVRAKVAALRLRQAEITPADLTHQRQLLVSYIELADRKTRPDRPSMILMHGVSGSGKSFVARQISSILPAILIRSDVERKRMFARTFANVASGRLPPQRYSEHSTDLIYRRLRVLAREIIESGYSVIVDATFLRREDRRKFVSLAKELAIPALILACTAERTVLRQRLMERQAIGTDASDADDTVLEKQLSAIESLDQSESEIAITVDASQQCESILKSILGLFRRLSGEVQ